MKTREAATVVRAAGEMGSLLRSQEELLKLQESLQKAASGELGPVSAELQSAHAALRKVADVPPENLDEEARLWVHDATELSYDIGDLLDSLLVGSAPAYPPASAYSTRRKRLWEKMSTLFRFKKERTRHHIVDETSHQRANAITDLMVRVKDLIHRLPGHRTDDAPGKLTAAGIVDPRLPALYRNEQELVGIHKPREELIELLAQSDDVHQQQHRKIVSITGFGGIGKTTLAKAVYNQIHGHFECSAFVTVSRNSDMKKVFKDILLKLDEKRYMGLLLDTTVDEKQLSDEIRRFLQNKRYFIVVDDIWSIESWGKIKSVLIENDYGSRIITTTRKTEVAAAVADEVYRLKPLSHASSEELFYKRIFGGGGNSPDNQLAKVSEKILENCGGSPLAIITIASVLASKSREEWSKVYNSIENGHEGSRYVENMKEILSFSYYDLPSHLRTCLLYLSLFTKDYWIEKDILIWRWVAEGFVSKQQERGLFEQGEVYFNELVNRGMIQAVENRYRWPVYGCRVHFTMHNFIHSLSSEENFATLLLGNEGHTSAARINARRLAMHKAKVEHNSEANMTIMRRVRLFTASLCLIDQIPELSSFQVLRVLALEYCHGMKTDHLKQIGNLVHLRYFSLAGTDVAELPAEAVQELRLLQTLDLRETRIEELPPTVFGLKHLMCLCADQISSANWSDMRHVTTLEELRIRRSDRGSFAGSEIMLLQQLKELRVLEIGFSELARTEQLVGSLCMLGKIQHLESYSTSSWWRSSETWNQPNGFTRMSSLQHLELGGIYFRQELPAWIHPARLQCLSQLHVAFGREVTVNDLETLGSFPELRSLVLMMVYGGRERPKPVNVGHGFFQKLRFLVINNLINFGVRRIYGSPMPSLEDYRFHYSRWIQIDQYWDCWQSSLENLPSLNKLTVQFDSGSRPFIGKLEARLKQVTSSHPNRPTLELISNDDPSQYYTYRPKNPRFEALRSEMEKLQANGQRGGESQ